MNKNTLRARFIRCIVCALAIGAILCVTAFAGAFPDVPDSASYAEAVNALVEVGVMNGGNDGNFRPDATITRAEASVVICRLLNTPVTAKESPFPDVPPTEWSVRYVATAAELGIFSGYSNGNFGPNDPVTFEQMVKVLISAWGYDDEAMESGGWPDGYLNVAENLDITKGTYLKGSVPCTRAAVAVLCYNILDIRPAGYSI